MTRDFRIETAVRKWLQRYARYNGSLPINKEWLDKDVAEFSAILTALREPGEREPDEKLNRFDECCANMSGYVDDILDHFDADGKIKGDGQWRLRKIYEHAKEADSEFKSLMEFVTNPPASPTPAGEASSTRQEVKLPDGWLKRQIADTEAEVNKPTTIRELMTPTPQASVSREDYPSALDQAMQKAYSRKEEIERLQSELSKQDRYAELGKFMFDTVEALGEAKSRPLD